MARRPSKHDILKAFDASDGIPHQDAPQSMGGIREPKAQPITEEANQRPAGYGKNGWRVPGFAQKPLLRKEEEQENPLAPKPISRTPITALRTDHALDERAPTRAEQRTLDRDKRRDDRKKRHTHLVDKKEASIIEGFVKQHERRERASALGEDEGPTGPGL